MGLALSVARLSRRILFYITLLLASASASEVLGQSHLPIIFIHGLSLPGSPPSDTWKPMMVAFQNKGFAYGDDLYFNGASVRNTISNTTNFNSGSLYTISFYDGVSFSSNNLTFAQQGFQLKQVIDAVKTATGFCKVILVGHSMGGLAARWYLENLPGSPTYSKDVAAFFTMGTPNEGADDHGLDLLAALVGAIKGGAAQYLLRGSRELLQINGVQPSYPSVKFPASSEVSSHSLVFRQKSQSGYCWSDHGDTAVTEDSQDYLTRTYPWVNKHPFDITLFSECLPIDMLHVHETDNLDAFVVLWANMLVAERPSVGCRLPQIDNINPSTIAKNQAYTFTLTGVGFVQNFSATLINELGQEFNIPQKEFVSSTTIRVTAFIGSGPTSTQTIHITNPNGQSASINFLAVTTTPTFVKLPTISLSLTNAAKHEYRVGETIQLMMKTTSGVTAPPDVAIPPVLIFLWADTLTS